MGQTEVIGVLKKEDNWMSAYEVSQILGMDNLKAVRRALKKMFDNNEIFKKEVKREGGTRIFLYKER